MKKWTTKIFLAFFVLLLSIIATAHLYATTYQITDLGLGQARGINNNQQVFINNSGDVFFWEDGGLNQILGVDGYNGSLLGYDINENGLVTGHAAHTTTNQFRPFIYNPETGVTINKNGFYTSDGRSNARGINDAGDIVGLGIPSLTQSSGSSALWYEAASTPVNIGLVGSLPFATATDINNSNNVIGYGYDANKTNYAAYFWDGSTKTIMESLGGTNTYAYKMNDNDLVIGFAHVVGDHYHAVYWDEDGIHDLHTTGTSSQAFGVDDSGSRIVGSVNGTQAVLWLDGVMYDLTDLIADNPGWELTNAFDVNDNGDIVGVGLLNGEAHAFLLTTQTIPEPATLVLFVMGVATLIRKQFFA